MVTNVTARSLFFTGLTENLRTLMMQKTTGRLREAINEAAKQGKLLKNKGKIKTQIPLCNMEDEKLEEQDLDEETVSKINHARTRQGRQPYQKFNNFRNNKQNGQGVQSGGNNHNNGNKDGNQQNREDWKCRYCNAPGHLQADCGKRNTAGVPLADRHGKPRGGNNKAIHEVESKEGGKFLGHLRQSSGEGCRSLQNQDNLNF
jgi:hypothetical protein